MFNSWNLIVERSPIGTNYCLPIYHVGIPTTPKLPAPRLKSDRDVAATRTFIVQPVKLDWPIASLHLSESCLQTPNQNWRKYSHTIEVAHSSMCHTFWRLVARSGPAPPKASRSSYLPSGEMMGRGRGTDREQLPGC
jgi:hypothetical protein